MDGQSALRNVRVAKTGVEQIFARTNLEVLKTENVQDSNEPGGISARVGAGVDLVHQPCECPGIQGFGHGMTVLTCLMINSHNFKSAILTKQQLV